MDLLVLQVPPLTIAGPPLGPSLVVASARKGGFKSQLIDLNLDLLTHTKHDLKISDWIHQDYVFDSDAAFEEMFKEHFEVHFERWIEDILKINPRWLGISVFSYRSWHFTNHILKAIRKRNTNIKLIVGGGEPTSNPEIAKRALDSGLIDAYVSGEAEEPIVALLRGELDAPGINGNLRPTAFDLSNYPAPDYTDIPVESYGYSIGNSTERVFYIETSRGCVRKCTFCNVPNSRPGFRMRPVSQIMQEIKDLQARYGAYKFSFVDNLINGSLIQLKELLTSLVQNRFEILAKSGNSLGWAAFLIVRPEEVFPPHWFDLLRQAGCQTVSIGVESGSERVRKDMNKRISDAAIDYTIQQCARVGIEIMLLLMVGYPSETEDDFQDTLSLLDRHATHSKNTIKLLGCSWRVYFDDDTKKTLPPTISLSYDVFGEWYTEQVNAKKSAQRFLILKEFALSRGYNIWAYSSDDLVKSVISKYEAIEKTFDASPVSSL